MPKKERRLSVSRFHDLRFAEHPNFPGAADLYRRMQGAPKFVFSRDIMEWLKEHAADYDHAVAVAIEAGRTELPYETMLVEWGHDTDELIFWLVDAVGPNSYRIWPAFHIPRAKRSMIFGDYFPASFASDGSAIVQPYQGWVPSPITRQFIDRYAPSAAISLCLAMTLHVRGIVTREPVQISPKLDAARIKKGKPPITKDYVTVHIGYSTDRQGKDHAYEEGRGHVKPHIRAGHYKNQAVGPGWQERKKIWIKPYLVNYGDDTSIASSPQYLVVP
jgi:hypothetical protein